MTAPVKINSVLSEAWSLVNGYKWPVFCAYISPVIPLTLLFIIIMTFLTNLIRLAMTSHTLSVFIFIGCVFAFLIGVFFLCLWVVMAALTILGIRRAIGLTPSLKVAFAQCLQAKKNLFYLFLIWLVTGGIFNLISQFALPRDGIGILLTILLYIVLLYFILPLMVFAVPLVVIKKDSLANAIASSFKTMNKNYVEVLPLNIMLIILSVISAIPLGIGLIWTVPFYYAMTGILFRELYGLKRKTNA